MFDVKDNSAFSFQDDVLTILQRNPKNEKDVSATMLNKHETFILLDTLLTGPSEYRDRAVAKLTATGIVRLNPDYEDPPTKENIS